MVCRWLLLIVLVSSLNELIGVWGLTCLPDSLSVSRESAIKDTFCENNDVYSAQVIAATCNCIPEADSTASAQCQHFELDSSNSIISTRVLSAGVCSGFLSPYLQNCDTVGKSLVSWGLRVEGDGRVDELTVRNLTTGSRSCHLACEFNLNSSSFEKDLQPCIYTIRIGEVFKGNYSSGDVVQVIGPDVLIEANNRVLQVNTEYLAGVGGLCNPINTWSQTSSFSSKELQMMRHNMTCGQLSVSTSIAGVVFSLALLVSLLPLLLMS